MMGRGETVLFAAVFVVLTAGRVEAAKTVWLSSLDLANVQQDWGRPQVNASVEGKKMSIDGKTFDCGVGTHAVSLLYVDLKGGSSRFSAMVGVDDEVTQSPVGIRFSVIGDARELWHSRVMKKGQPAEKVDVDLSGVKTLLLLVENEGPDMDFCHADWADAKFEVVGESPVALPVPKEPKVVLTPKPPATPRINGRECSAFGRAALSCSALPPPAIAR